MTGISFFVYHRYNMDEVLQRLFDDAPDLLFPLHYLFCGTVNNKNH